MERISRMDYLDMHKNVDVFHKMSENDAFARCAEALNLGVA
jgi:hypothetical protein